MVLRMSNYDGRAASAAVVVVSLAVVALSACSGAPRTQYTADASWANAYPSVRAMASHSDAIVVADVRAIAATGSDPTSDGQGIPFTDFTVQVENWIAPKSGPASILIHQTGVQNSSMNYETSDDPLLTPGEHDVLFLHQYAPGRYFIMGGPTGRFRIAPDGTVSALSHGIARDGLPESVGAFSARVAMSAPRH